MGGRRKKGAKMSKNEFRAGDWVVPKDSGYFKQPGQDGISWPLQVQEVAGAHVQLVGLRGGWSHDRFLPWIPAPGTRVCLVKPADPGPDPTWVSAMDRYNGAIVEVGSPIYDLGCPERPRFCGPGGWGFAYRWCVPIYPGGLVGGPIPTPPLQAQAMQVDAGVGRFLDGAARTTLPTGEIPDTPMNLGRIVTFNRTTLTEREMRGVELAKEVLWGMTNNIPSVDLMRKRDLALAFLLTDRKPAAGGK
mgnify:CR=1 FL=1